MVQSRDHNLIGYSLTILPPTTILITIFFSLEVLTYLWQAWCICNFCDNFKHGVHPVVTQDHSSKSLLCVRAKREKQWWYKVGLFESRKNTMKNENSKNLLQAATLRKDQNRFDRMGYTSNFEGGITMAGKRDMLLILLEYQLPSFLLLTVSFPEEVTKGAFQS